MLTEQGASSSFSLAPRPRPPPKQAMQEPTRKRAHPRQLEPTKGSSKRSRSIGKENLTQQRSEEFISSSEEEELEEADLQTIEKLTAQRQKGKAPVYRVDYEQEVDVGEEEDDDVKIVYTSITSTLNETLHLSRTQSSQMKEAVRNVVQKVLRKTVDFNYIFSDQPYLPTSPKPIEAVVQFLMGSTDLNPKLLLVKNIIQIRDNNM